MIRSVSKVSGTTGSAKKGSSLGNSPMSPTVRNSSPIAMETPVSTMMVMSGEGTAFVSRGSR